ncbi:MAG: 4Fe-4S cluster-binding domain-containing protein [Candidatus Levybacteria bacterium]|nr:4Fe-4S cluster-binding domain-containing protein [Candidatus Levybacteria bacterium]
MPTLVAKQIRKPSLVDTLKVTGTLVKAIAAHPEGAISIFSRGNRPIGASFDIAANCNLRCQHCYLFNKDHQEEGISNEEEYLATLRRIKQENPSIVHVTWVGGEPMSRKRLLREAVKVFSTNWVVTNGTIPIDGEWKNTAFFISIDGTEEVHNKIRQPYRKTLTNVPQGQELTMATYNVYQRAKKNCQTATAPTLVHTVINKINKDTITDLVAEWKKDTPVRGFAFSLHTPKVDKTGASGMSENDKKLFLPDNERRTVVEMLLELKKQYGNFIIMSDEQIRDFLPERQLEVFGANCALARGAVYSFDAKFERKNPCVMGPGMNCGKCGCVIPTIFDRVAQLDLATMKATLMTLPKASTK